MQVPVRLILGEDADSSVGLVPTDKRASRQCLIS
jgi:hypothetical protein